MIFRLFGYLNPTSYFNLKPKVDHTYFPTAKQVKAFSHNYPEDTGYESSKARERDLAFQAFHYGYINKEESNVEGLNIWEKEKLPLKDEYRFLRKNFSPIWVFYVLVIRMLSLKNPVNEVLAFLKTKGVARLKYHDKPVVYDKEYDTFQSSLIKENPKVSIVIPTLNRYKYLKDVFIDLEKQTYKNFEVIVVDQTDPFDESVYQGWNFDLKYWYQKEKALWKARNDAIKSSQGDYILLYDDDSLVDENWIEEHIKSLDFFNCDLSSGVSISTVGAKVPEHYSYFRWSGQLDTGNVLLKKSVFDKIGLFDEQFEKQRMGDGEFGLRAYLAGFRNLSNPKAKRIHLKVESGGLRQMGSWDAVRPKKIFAPKPIPSVLYLHRKYFGNKLTYKYLLRVIPMSMVPYKWKSSSKALLSGFFLCLFLLPIVFVQVGKSWRISNKMLKEGAKIREL